MPDVPELTSFGLTKGFYIGAGDIARKCLDIFDHKTDNESDILPEPVPHDIPGDWFKGPFKIYLLFEDLNL